MPKNLSGFISRICGEFPDQVVSVRRPVRVAEYEVTEDRLERFRRALEDGLVLVNRALQLDAANGGAYLARAAMTAYADLAAAEDDYRRGLDLAPNSAEGYAGLAAVVYERPERRPEALELLEHARKLDPLEPGYGVQISVFQLYEQGDPRAAAATLREVVGGKTVEIEDLAGLTVGQMLEQLFGRFPALQSKLLNREGDFHAAFHILINGRDARYLDGPETVIKADDEIRIFPPVGGGSGEAQL